VILANLANLKRDRKILLVNGWAGTLNVGKDNRRSTMKKFVKDDDQRLTILKTPA